MSFKIAAYCDVYGSVIFSVNFPTLFDQSLDDVILSGESYIGNFTLSDFTELNAAPAGYIRVIDGRAFLPGYSMVGSAGAFLDKLLVGKHTDDGINKLQVEGSASVSGNLTVTKNTTELVYNQAGLSINTIDLSSPILAFHRVGLSATALYETDGELYVNAWVSKPQTGKLISSGNYNSYSTFTGTISNPAVSFSGTALPNSLVVDSAGKVGINTTSPTEKLNVAGNILATGTVSGSNISNSYVWVFVITSTSTAYNTSDAYNASNNYVKPRTGDTVGSAFTDSATLPSFYNKNVVVYRSTTTSSYSAYEQVFPDITITTGGVCTISFAVAQTVGYVFRVIFS
jgi:hypothetical protein